MRVGRIYRGYLRVFWTPDVSPEDPLYMRETHVGEWGNAVHLSPEFAQERHAESYVVDMMKASFSKHKDGRFAVLADAIKALLDEPYFKQHKRQHEGRQCNTMQPGGCWFCRWLPLVDMVTDGGDG